mmetsp:Transcript_15216/g.35951  ORF Transcript_15216/g.35951 Transcript_15216/m.35951 type:complete len:320 (-) Transcript_15216:90-1049(-)
MATSSIDEKPEEELTNDERLAWLRARGVIVEEPAGRKPVGGGAPFMFVRIPADESSSCEERTAAKSAGDALPSLLGPEFAGDAGVSDEQLMAQAAQMGQSVSAAAMRSVMARGGAETFRLSVPTDSNGREAVYAYLDEASALKGLPKNERASALAQRCGFPATCQFYGDIFVGRQKWHKGGVVENIDFKLADLDASAFWAHRAVTENLEFQKDTQPEEHARAQESAGPSMPASGAGDGYTWRDEDDALEVVVQVAKGTGKRDVKVEFRKQEVRVTKPLSLSLKLFKPVDVDGCNWTLGDGTIILTLDKAAAAPWPQLLA